MNASSSLDDGVHAHDSDSDSEGDEEALDDMLRRVVPGFDGLPDGEKNDYRGAYSILLAARPGASEDNSLAGDQAGAGLSKRGTRPSMAAARRSVRSLLVDTLEDEGMRAVVRGTLLSEEGAHTKACVYSIASFVLLAAVLAFVLWFILAFGLTRGRAVISSFMVTFWASQATTLLITEPLVILLALAWALTFGPTVNKFLNWVPCCGAKDEAATFSGSRVLSGRVENVAMLHAVGATAGLAGSNSLLVFSSTAALSAALASDFAAYGHEKEEERRARGTARTAASGDGSDSGSDTDAAAIDIEALSVSGGGLGEQEL